MAEYAEFKASMAKDYPLNDTADGAAPKGDDPNISPVVKGKAVMEDSEMAIEKETPDDAEKEKELKKAAQLGAELAIKAFASKMGIHLPSAGASTVPTKKSFAEIVESETKRFDGDKTKAMIHCIKTYSAEYAASRNVR
jgi:inorganic pyrophosphatase/exopolyphosphatase